MDEYIPQDLKRFGLRRMHGAHWISIISIAFGSGLLGYIFGALSR